MPATTRDDQICTLQTRLLDITIGCTTTVRGIAVTRWAKDAFEINTWGRSAGVGSETAAEQLLELAPSF